MSGFIAPLSLSSQRRLNALLADNTGYWRIGDNCLSTNSTW